jgi:hypothetical protein
MSLEGVSMNLLKHQRHVSPTKARLALTVYTVPLLKRERTGQQTQRQMLVSYP